MSTENAGIAILKSHDESEIVVKELQRSGFDMKMLSIVGKDYHTDEHVIGYYNAGERMKYWGKQGAFWDGIWGVLFGSAFFLVPGVGPLLVAGPLVATIIGAAEGAVLVGGLSIIGAGLMSIGIPKDSILQYETEIKSDRFMVMVHGTERNVSKARDILKTMGHEVAVHSCTKPEKAHT